MLMMMKIMLEISIGIEMTITLMELTKFMETITLILMDIKDMLLQFS